MTEAVTTGKGSFVRRDRLIEMEKWAQAQWATVQPFQKDAPAQVPEDRRKFMATFPYPYANGRLHVGHGFSLTKAEFPTRYHQLKGEDAFFPFAFHCTGMPIQAAAGNLKREMEESDEPEEVVPVVATTSAAEIAASRAEAGVFKSSKSKAKSKSGGLSQSDILRGNGVSEADIEKFVDPQHWLTYFPPLYQEDIKHFGGACDWRRSFITTDRNPYYDAFVRWQFRKLRAAGKVQFGNRPAVFARREKQPCADHDRKSGEGIGHTEYTLIKLQVQSVPESWSSLIDNNSNVFLVAATLRPETMCGQTNCFVLPEGEYGLFKMYKNGINVNAPTSSGEVNPHNLTQEFEYFVCSKRSAHNMVWQGLGPREADHEGVEGAIELLSIKGQDILGLPLSAPMSPYKTVYALPMLTISMGKGTGVVTSVPADSPDDFACLRDWQTKKNMRDQFQVKEEWCVPFEVITIISVPDLLGEGADTQITDASAPFIVNHLKIESHKDKQKLEEAKKICYLKGFEFGTMTAGMFSGMPVKEAKPLTRKYMLENHQACVYFEPEGVVISRSGDECVVALCDQWYIPYGEAGWMHSVVDHLKSTNFEMFNKSALNQQIGAVEWFKAWACSRTFGLGTRLPWDEHWIIESLSDSTIYMAYYTIAHLLQGDIYGSVPGQLDLSPSQVTDSLFEYAFDLSDTLPEHLTAEQAAKLRQEFVYWYPVDLRVSGKDLIPNHLTMCLYIHAAIWPTKKQYWPRAYFCNGHVLVDGQKMSKSLGNFMTVQQVCNDYGADAARIALADAGDDLEDANFVKSTADKNILELWNLEQFVIEYLGSDKQLRTGEFNFLDKAFENELNALVVEADKQYSKMCFRGALKACWFEMRNLRDQYRSLCEATNSMHYELLRRWVECLVITLSPIAPHFSEYMWRHSLGHTTCLAKEGKWPVVSAPYDRDIAGRYAALQQSLRNFRLEQQKWVGAAKGQKPGTALIFVAKEYPVYQQEVLKLLKAEIKFDDSTNEPLDGKGWITTMKALLATSCGSPAAAANSLKFATFHVQTEVRGRGASALELSLPYDEIMMLKEYEAIIKRQLEVKDIQILPAELPCDLDNGKQSKREAALPGKPTVLFLKE